MRFHCNKRFKKLHNVKLVTNLSTQFGYPLGNRIVTWPLCDECRSLYVLLNQKKRQECSGTIGVQDMRGLRGCSSRLRLLKRNEIGSVIEPPTERGSDGAEGYRVSQTCLRVLPLVARSKQFDGHMISRAGHTLLT
jgi:hypothetical protein